MGHGDMQGSEFNLETDTISWFATELHAKDDMISLLKDLLKRETAEEGKAEVRYELSKILLEKQEKIDSLEAEVDDCKVYCKDHDKALREVIKLEDEIEKKDEEIASLKRMDMEGMFTLLKHSMNNSNDMLNNSINAFHSAMNNASQYDTENQLLKARLKDAEDLNTRYRAINEQLTKTIKAMQEWTSEEGLVCDICETKNTGLEVHEDQYGKRMVCSKCCVRMTGFSSVRIEKIMVEFLKQNYDFPMSVVDKRIQGEACLAYRPDVTYIDHSRVVHVECDENQHKSYTCDEARMTKMYTEYPGKTAIWIRWNPHDYKAEEQKSQGERLRVLAETLKKVETMEFESKINVIYLFYDKDSPVIVKNIAHSFIY